MYLDPKACCTGAKEGCIAMIGAKQGCTGAKDSWETFLQLVKIPFAPSPDDFRQFLGESFAKGLSSKSGVGCESFGRTLSAVPKTLCD